MQGAVFGKKYAFGMVRAKAGRNEEISVQVYSSGESRGDNLRQKWS